VRGVRVERVREFGRAWAALSVWRRLGCTGCCRRRCRRGRRAWAGWDAVVCVLTIGRFCAQAGELSVAKRWDERTALPDGLGIPADAINWSRLYRGLDQLLGCKDAICSHLRARKTRN
jgi:hypothetical protein